MKYFTLLLIFFTPLVFGVNDKCSSVFFNMNRNKNNVTTIYKKKKAKKHTSITYILISKLSKRNRLLMEDLWEHVLKIALNNKDYKIGSKDIQEIVFSQEHEKVLEAQFSRVLDFLLRYQQSGDIERSYKDMQSNGKVMLLGHNLAVEEKINILIYRIKLGGNEDVDSVK